VLDTARQLLEHSPLLALFAAIGIGYAVGRISIAGFSLDIGAVLFAGLALGAIAPAAAPPALVSSIGLVMFLYGIGIQYGRQFFAASPARACSGTRIAVIGVISALVVTLAAVKVFGVPVPQAMGLFAGALTSTPTLQAAIRRGRQSRSGARILARVSDGRHRSDSAHLYLYARRTREAGLVRSASRAVEISLAAHWQGSTVGDIIASLPAGVDLVAVRRGTTNQLPEPSMPLAADDIVLVFGRPAPPTRRGRNLAACPQAGSPMTARDRRTAFFLSRAPRSRA
jgi:putative transport protein